MIEVSRCNGGITIEGHAGFAPEGRDIVCAAVSTLVQVLIQSIENLTEDKIEYEIQPGWVDIKHGNLSERGKLLVDSFFVGITMISDSYPHYVQIVQA